MRVTHNESHQPTRPYHGIPLNGIQLGRHVERCEHIISNKEIVAGTHPPSAFIRRAIDSVRSITIAPYLSRELEPGSQDIGDYNQYFMRPEMHRELASREDCLYVRLDCLEIAVSSSKLTDQDSTT